MSSNLLYIDIGMKKILALIVLVLLTGKIFGQELHLYGGEDHNVYLGCLTSSPYDSDSVWNDYGKYGNPYSSKSIWNPYSTYGNEFSSYSPFNEFASYPPIIVDSRGNFYGYLTANEGNSKRAEFRLALMIIGNYEEISENVSEWYSKFAKMGLVD